MLAGTRKEERKKKIKTHKREGISAQWGAKKFQETEQRTKHTLSPRERKKKVYWEGDSKGRA